MAQDLSFLARPICTRLFNRGHLTFGRRKLICIFHKTPIIPLFPEGVLQAGLYAQNVSFPAVCKKYPHSSNVCSQLPDIVYIEGE